MTGQPTTEPAELAPLIEAGYQLVPLHNHAYEDEHKGKRRKRGKSPIHGNWTKRPYRSADQVDHMETGDNVGVRLTAADLILDVDPRNFPDGETLDTSLNPFVDLVLWTGIDPDQFPTVVTGSGGLHIYMTKPEGISTRDSLGEDFPGVEFKSLGRQVVAPGSIHPDTLSPYTWDRDRPELDAFGADPAPDGLLDLVRRPDGAAPTGGGEHDQEELAVMLEALDPEDFQDHADWLQLMQACHHATAGDGRDEFIEWCTRDTAYADHGTIIGLRWDSLHADNKGARVTYKTLHKLLRDAGAEDAIPRTPAADDFDDLDEETLSALAERERKEDRRIGETSVRERLSVRRIDLKRAKRDLVYVSLAGGVVDLRSGRAWRTVELAATHFAGSRMTMEPEKPKDGGDGPKRGRPPQPKEMRVVNVWVGDRNGDRKTVDVMTWAPGRRAICAPPEGRGEAVNTWSVLTFKDAPDDWTVRAAKFVDHVRWLLPDGDDADDFLDWVAHIVQHPGVLPHTAWLMITSKRGVGRNWVASVLARVLAGHAALGVDLGDVLGGSFNERLSEKLLLVVDETREGSGADRHRKANKLQKVITEEHREINPKFGLKSVQYNCCRFLMFSNFMDALPIDDRDRRIRVAYNPESVREPSYYRDLYETRRDPRFVASVARFLRERDLSAFNPGLPAPMTDAKRSVVEFLETDEHRELKALFEAWPADLIGLSDVVDHLEATCDGFPSNLKFIVDEAGGSVTQRRFNKRGSGGSEKDRVVIARRGEWDALRVKREKPAVMAKIIDAARAEWRAREKATEDG
ncbi:bifunctional DNA primase/polymerase [uncultured Roseobacter sp.]|uniref:bifunctional DNA primase/polymerase n=1 Tax=uncultured Roseobacter sp. TaxID=114847 RepID=UPI002603D6A2|nr:bifunctional DNA primase/polymerase [uncultured Roseobacter sp.]